MPSLSNILAKLKIHLGPKVSGEPMVYVVYGKQPSLFPELEFIEPIIAVVASEQECFAIQEKHPETEVCWEARKVEGAAGNGSAGGNALYLAHTTLLPYNEDANGNPVFGIMESPRATALYFSRTTAELDAPDQYLHIVSLGEVNLRGVGEILE